MKIEDFIYFKEFFVKEKKEFFQEGNLIEGEILEVEDQVVLIHIKDYGTIKAKSEKLLNHHKGKILSFIIKESSPDKIQLKPILNSVNLTKTSVPSPDRDEYLNNILKEFNIRPSPISIKFLDNLIKFNLPINKENLVYGIGVLDKFDQIINVQEDEVIVLPNLKEEVVNIKKEDIRNFLIIKGNENPNNQADLHDNINIEMKELGKSFSMDKIGTDLLKIITVFIKYNIKPSLNNIKYFLELNENSTLFSKDFEILKNIIDKKFTKQLKRIMINNGGFKNSTPKTHPRYDEILNRTLEYLKDYSSNTNKDFKKTIEELIDKIEFLKEMNNELIFVYLPLNLDEKIQDTFITLLNKRKKESGYGNKINIFINLNTKKLGNIKIHCSISNSNMDIRFSGIKEEYISLFKSNEYELKDLVETTGYKIKTIEYLSKKDYTILDSLVVNRKTIYNLDMQV